MRVLYQVVVHANTHVPSNTASQKHLKVKFSPQIDIFEFHDDNTGEDVWISSSERVKQGRHAKKVLEKNH